MSELFSVCNCGRQEDCELSLIEQLQGLAKRFSLLSKRNPDERLCMDQLDQA